MITSATCLASSTDAFFLAAVYAPDVKGGIDAALALFKTLKHKPNIDINDKSGLKICIEGKIEFRNVSFAYPSRKGFAIKNLSFILEPKSSLAILGKTGSGKSTIIQLLLRLYDPTNGNILFDDIDLTDFNIKHLRGLLSIVSQEPILFSGSIKDNIAYGIKNPDIQDILNAAEKAQALEFIDNNPAGFEREVGLKGCMLSGGQKQRIAIARAIIRNPKILILDEATSALDARTEKILLKDLNTFIEERTCIMIAHRLKTIEKAAKVLVIEAGRILEFGNREELLRQGGYFYNMIIGL